VTSTPEDKQNQSESSDNRTLGITNWWRHNGAVRAKATFFTWCFNRDRGGTLAYQAAKSQGGITEALA